MNSTEIVRLTVKRLYPGLHPLKQTAAQIIKDFEKPCFIGKKEISQSMNTVINISLPYTVAFKQQCYVGLSIVVNVSMLPTATNPNIG